jgi:hypothetical protein
MPVSKKRKKAGKPVQRKEGVAPAAEHPHGPEVKAAAAVPTPRGGKPSNPFVAQNPAKRGAQRGR